MFIDFSKIGDIDSTNKILHPREIFMSLPEKHEKYAYPRDVQSEVWNQWFELKDNEYNVIKMNTGSGKTVIGLMILKSCLNEEKGPAVYIVPDLYLVSQVMSEARNLGIETTTDEDDFNFRKGKSILVTTIHKLINGKSVFGMRTDGTNIPIGSIVIDDAHACLNTTESQFTIEISANEDRYSDIYNLFREDLKQQSDSKVLDIDEGIPQVRMLVPYWAWQSKIEDVDKILRRENKSKNLMFTYPLIRDCFKLCNCVISTEKIEISPKSIPIHKISSFYNTKRKIFMSATLADDSILVSHFNVNIEKLDKIITPARADDIGDRLILVPQEINTNLTDDDLKNKFKELSKIHNVIVIVPSDYRAKYWNDVADDVLRSSNLHTGIQKLKNGHVGLVILVNRYDGIDLPDSACRILVIDGLPDARSEYDKVEQSVLLESERILNEKIQKIEQGMGRGVRSNTDYCVVFLMGKNLTSTLYAEGALNKFSAATKAQMDLSSKISEQVRGKGIDEIINVIDYLLTRNLDWIKANKRFLVSIEYDKTKKINPTLLAMRKAFDVAEKRDYQNSTKILLEHINTIENNYLKGWLKQQLAEYENHIDPVSSQSTLKSAINDNIHVLKPIEGIQYMKKLDKYSSQSRQFVSFINKKGLNENTYILKIYDLVEKLVFIPDTAPSFEEALKELAYYIGYTARRPENEVGKGPDVLWRIGELSFLVIECKNGATNEIINKHDCNQLNGSITWFDTHYEENDCNCTPIMIHPNNVFEYACSPHKDIRILTKDKLQKLSDNIIGFAKSVVLPENFKNLENINKLLIEFKLDNSNFVNSYTTSFRVKNN
ncbi:hypothetical protein DW1_2420 [Proteiniborus sp. DW1]|uniref:DEAD/DEAH box helicase family protein n=1 Tax=Proteiniborus sp. DW1 TaxID=1889883 RepID=UPI00092E1269|nr:DEAD/DEAH box helicase family protein [Proteiniborus sp. DW1]SCG83984.1 hypothetical protein DW1_2420 [Proteiniborus sp. DW1]